MNNYDDLLRDKENNEMFNENSLEKHWAAAEKTLDAKRIIPKPKSKNVFKIIFAAAASLLLLFVGYTFLKDKKPQTIIPSVGSELLSAIKPLLKDLNIPYENFSFDAAIGDTIFTQNGSIIIFPKHAVVNSKGEIVEGKIDVRTREFNDPLAFGLAGIPMDYDSAGVQYKFVSSSMIDITAYQNGERLQVNPNAKPQLNLVSTNKEKNTNLYQLDTISGKWSNKGRDEVNVVRSEKKMPGVSRDSIINKSLSSLNFDNGDDFYEDNNTDTSAYRIVNAPSSTSKRKLQKEITKPIPPQKASTTNTKIHIEIVPGSFKELEVYDGLVFEVLKSNMAILKSPIKSDNDYPSTNIRDIVEADSKIEWENIILTKPAANGNYIAKFYSKEKNVEYVVKPVLEGKDFEAAEKLYQQKMKEYESLKNNREQGEKEQQQKYADRLKKDSLQELVQDSENKKIEELNKYNKKRNETIIEENKRVIELNKLIALRNEYLRKNQNKIQENQMLSVNLVRSFQIDGFGYWNCDQPTLPQVFFVKATYKNSKNYTFTYFDPCVAVKDVNRLLTENGENLSLFENKPQCIFGVIDDKFYYLSYKQFTQLNITKTTKEYNFVMNEYTGSKIDYYELKKLLYDM